ncbi:hypothetical protein ABZ800_27905 [Streptomyces sp. NPDC047813]|uniref:hypothetical protein n=1 Tax=Streptomyces sp. NPDC047813 TaxID=3154608 RepID=UPI0033D67540
MELLAIAATMWSLAGYQANASTLAAAFTDEVRRLFTRGEFGVAETPVTAAPYRIAELTGAVLRRDLDCACTDVPSSGRSWLTGSGCSRMNSGQNRWLFTCLTLLSGIRAPAAARAAGLPIGRCASCLSFFTVRRPPPCS